MHPISTFERQPQTSSAYASFSHTLTGRIVLAVAASLFVALCAHVSVPLPFTPVPLTLSNMAVVLVGLVLGPELAFAALLLYLAEGASGMPVFNPTGPGGIAQLLGPTGGYLFSYPLAAALAGFAMHQLKGLRSRFAAATIAAAGGTALVLLCGVTWLAVELHLSAGQAFVAGAMPFLPGEIVKVLAAAGIATALVRSRS